LNQTIPNTYWKKSNNLDIELEGQNNGKHPADSKQEIKY